MERQRNVSPERGSSGGSTSTSLCTSRIHLARKSVVSSWRMWINPASLQICAWSLNGEPGPTRAYRRQVVDRPAKPQMDMVVEVRLHIEEEPMLGNGDGGQCAGGTLFTSNHHSTAKLVRQSSLNSISHQRQVQLTLTRHCSLGSTIRIDSGSGRQGRFTGTDEVSEGSSALDGVSMLAPGISHWVVESHATICCRKRQHLQLEIIGLVLRHSGDQLSANRILQRLHVVPCRRHGALDKRPTVPQAKDIGSVSCVGLSGSNIREAIHLSDPSSYRSGSRGGGGGGDARPPPPCRPKKKIKSEKKEKNECF